MIAKAVNEMIADLESGAELSANQHEMLTLLVDLKHDLEGRTLDRNWVVSMIARVGRRITVDVVMRLYGYKSERVANLAINRAMEVTPEQVDGTAEKLIAGGVVC